MVKQIRTYAAYVVPPVLLVLWLIGFSEAFTSELASVKIMPDLIKMTSAQRTALAGGPMYELTEKAAAVIPKEARIFFFNPPIEGGGHYSGKARYYLYPTPVIEVNSGDNLDAGVFKDGDYLVFFIPGTFLDTNFEAGLTRAIPSEMVWGVSDSKGRRAIYRVTG